MEDADAVPYLGNMDDLSDDDGADAATGKHKVPDEPLHSRPLVAKDGATCWEFTECAAMDAATAARLTATRAAACRGTSSGVLSPTRMRTLAAYVCDAVGVVRGGKPVVLDFPTSFITEVPFAWTPLFHSDAPGGVHAAAGFATETVMAANALWGHAILAREDAVLDMLAVEFDVPDGSPAPSDLETPVREFCGAIWASLTRLGTLGRVTGASLASVKAVCVATGSEACLPLWQQRGGVDKMNAVSGALRLADRFLAGMLCEPPTDGAMGKVRETHGSQPILEVVMLSFLARDPAPMAAHLVDARAALSVLRKGGLTALKLAEAAVRPGMRDMVTQAQDHVVWFYALLEAAVDNATKAIGPDGETSFETAFARLRKLTSPASGAADAPDAAKRSIAPSAGFYRLVGTVATVTLSGVVMGSTGNVGDWLDVMRREGMDPVVVAKLVRGKNVDGDVFDDALVAAVG